MESTIFKFIMRYSKAQQLWLLGVITVSYPFLYLSLDLPKLIVDRAIGNDPPGPPYDLVMFGARVAQIDVGQIEFLLALSFAYLLLVLINGALKYHINVYKGRMGERLLRRLRYTLYERIMRFPLPHFRKVSQGELIPMITAEVEPLGGFIGTAYTDPMFQGGQLVIILSFIMIQDPFLGAAAIALYPFQIYVIPRLQRGVNQLGKARVQNVRKLSDHIAESASGVTEARAHDTVLLELARFAQRLGVIYWIRYDIYRRKFFIKFLNNFIDKITPFFFFSIGGWLVIEGDLSFGALVAVLTAYKDLAGPWKEMLTWYQQKEDARIKYEQVIEQFDPPGLVDPYDTGPASGEQMEIRLDGTVTAQNVSVVDDDGFRPLDGVTFEFPARSHIAVIGKGNSGRSELLAVVAGLVEPAAGAVLLGGRNLNAIPRQAIGRRLAYVGPGAYLQAGSVADALAYGLKHRPVETARPEGEAAKKRELEKDEARRSGNIELDYEVDWIDYEAAGATGPSDLRDRMLEALRVVGFDDDIYARGLRGTINPDMRPEIAEKILEARRAVRNRLSDPALANLVEPFDASHYNMNASVAENVIFGVPIGTALADDRIAEHPYMRRVLERVGLAGDFMKIGERVAETMVELFADLPPGHEFFEQFSFISAEDLPEFQAILARAARGLDTLSEADQNRLIALPFKLIPARHRLDLIDEALQARLLEARYAFSSDLPPELAGKIAFFDANAYNAGATIQDNILFGKLVYGQPNATQRGGALIAEVLDGLNLREVVMDVGLDRPVGAGGARMSQVQRQQIAIARGLLKRPDLLLISEAAATMEAGMQARLIDNSLATYGQGTVIWALSNAGLAEKFEYVLVMDEGRVAEFGTYDSLRQDSVSAYNRLMQGA